MPAAVPLLAPFTMHHPHKAPRLQMSRRLPRTSRRLLRLTRLRVRQAMTRRQLWCHHITAAQAW